MFTGLIETVGTFMGLRQEGRAGELTVQAVLPPPDDLALGDSIAVNGVCLTVTRFTRDTITFHTLAETLSLTNLGGLHAGAGVNLERALRLGDRLGGHIVSGHVDGMASVLDIGKRGDDMELTLELPEALAPYVVYKGSIAVNGISLTIARLTADALGVCIIPHTWTHTNLCSLRRGDAVNLETDICGRYVLRQRELEHMAGGSGITMETLAGAGFM